MLDKLNLIYERKTGTARLGWDTGLMMGSNYYLIRKLEDHEFLEKEDIDLTSEKTKVLIQTRAAFFHMFVETLAEVSVAINYFDSDVHFIIDLMGAHPAYEDYDIEKKRITNNIYHMIEVLKRFNIKYTFVDSTTQNFIVNNYYIFVSVEDFARHFELAGNTYKKYFVNDKNLKPTKKVYLSRNHLKGRNEVELFGKNKNSPTNSAYLINSASRLPDENKLTDFLKDVHGFEIINPELDFKDLEEQINYMYEAKVLMGLSGSGLINMAFMQPHTTLVELSVPLFTGNETKTRKDGTKRLLAIEEYHAHYLPLSLSMNLTYYSIPHQKDVNDIIKTMKNNEIINRLISG